MKKKVRLTEKDLHNIVQKSVYRILKENEMDEKFDWKRNLKNGAIGLGMLGATAAADKLYDKNQDDNYDTPEIELSNQPYFNDEDYYDEYGRYPADDTIPLYEKINKNNKNMKKIIRLTENDIHRIVKNSVNKILKEMDEEKEQKNPYRHLAKIKNPAQKYYQKKSDDWEKMVGNLKVKKK